MNQTAEQNEFESFRRLLDQARTEDLGGGDITCSIIPPQANVEAKFVAREDIIFCGGVFLDIAAKAYDDGISTEIKVSEGSIASAGTTLALWSGSARAILSAERPALNFLQRLSGIATLTRSYVEAAAGGAEIFDTRKTIPAWRVLDKYAVRTGGGKNHRMGLYDSALIKDNHLAILSGAGAEDSWAALAEKIPSLRLELGNNGFIEIEVDNFDQLHQALELPIDIILLDNFTPHQLRLAVDDRNNSAAPAKPLLEASGGITLENVAQIAQTGVERIAIGALTHSSRAVDIALDIDPT